jgi:lipid-binding SYLF domain-containing protein
MSVEGARLAPHQKSMDRYYGERLWADDVLFGRKNPALPPESKRLIEALP